MPLEMQRSVNCSEAQAVLPLFADGELDAALMQAVAAHGARCARCDQELQRLERLRAALLEHVEAKRAGIRSEDLWLRIEARLPRRTVRVPRWRQWYDWLAEHLGQPQVLWPAVAMVAVAVMATVLLLRSEPRVGPGSSTLVAGLEPPAVIDSLEADVGSVAVMDDWQNHTTVLWVSDELPIAGGTEP